MSNNYYDYKVGDKFKIDCTNVVYVLAFIDEDTHHLFVRESTYDPSKDYSEDSIRDALEWFDYEWVTFEDVIKIEDDPSENKSPAEQLGYEVGDEFEIVSRKGIGFSDDWEIGDHVILIEDDGSDCPYFEIKDKPDVDYQQQYVSLAALSKVSNATKESAIVVNGNNQQEYDYDKLATLNDLLKEVSNHVSTPSLYIQPSIDAIKYTLTIDSFEFDFKTIDEVINKLKQFLTFVEG